MKVIRVFFLGLVYGWFMRWIIDQIFINDNLKMIINENIMLKERIQFLEKTKTSAALPAPQAEPMAAPLPAPRARPVSAPEPRTTAPASRKDDLKVIKGIGPQMEKKLNNAGVITFEQMSRLTTTDLQNILGLSKRVVQNADNLINQAKKFAQQKPRKS